MGRGVGVLVRERFGAAVLVRVGAGVVMRAFDAAPAPRVPVAVRLGVADRAAPAVACAGAAAATGLCRCRASPLAHRNNAMPAKTVTTPAIVLVISPSAHHVSR